MISKGDNAFKGINWNVSCGSPDSSILSLWIEICRNLFRRSFDGHFLKVFLAQKQQQEINKHITMIIVARKRLNLFFSKKSSPRIVSRISSSPSFSKGGSTPIINLSLGIESGFLDMERLTNYRVKGDTFAILDHANGWYFHGFKYK